MGYLLRWATLAVPAAPVAITTVPTIVLVAAVPVFAPLAIAVSSQRRIWGIDRHISRESEGRGAEADDGEEEALDEKHVGGSC